MSHDILMLIFAAIPVGFIHTLMGPDHYVPFIAMARERNWSTTKTLWVTALCGAGHVLSAVALGMIGIAIGFTFAKFNLIENWRGELAAWLLISFGLAYFVYGLRSALKNKKHAHLHIFHNHHNHDHASRRELTPWILFIIFILGPCEPLLPLMMYPAIKDTELYVFLVCLVFGITTVATMLLAVFATLYGMRFIKMNFWEKYGSATTGGIICCLGLGIKFLGL